MEISTVYLSVTDYHASIYQLLTGFWDVAIAFKNRGISECEVAVDCRRLAYVNS